METMKIDVDEIDPIQRKIHIEVAPERVAGEFAKAYQSFGQRVRVKGFRAGKTPRTVLQGLYGEEIKVQVRSQLVEDLLGEVIKERGLEIVSRPEIDANELQEGSPFSFSAVFEVKPQIEIKNYLDLEVEKTRFAVTDAQVEEALEQLRESHAHLEPVDDRHLVERGDFIAIDFEGTLGGKPFAGGKGENYLLEIGGRQALPEFEDALIGFPRGEQRSVQVKYPDSYPNREIAGKSVDFTVTVREIKRKVLPPLDDDFAKDHGECASLEELRGVIRKRLEQELEQIQNEALKEQLVNRLIESHSFTPPHSLVDRQTRYLMERAQNRGASARTPQEAGAAPSAEQLRKTLEARATRQVQATLLIEKIAEREKIEVSDAEMRDRIEKSARAAGERAKAVREYYSQPDAREELRAQVSFDRTLDFLLQRARVKEVDAPRSKVDEHDEKS